MKGLGSLLPRDAYSDARPADVAEHCASLRVFAAFS